MNEEERRLGQIWLETFDEIVSVIPPKVRAHVLGTLWEEEKRRAADTSGPKVVMLADVDPKEFKNMNRIFEGLAVIVQVCVRKIANNNSKYNAAAILFRKQRQGHGSGYLHEYLDGLPGITMDKSCYTIADHAGESHLDKLTRAARQ